MYLCKTVHVIKYGNVFMILLKTHSYTANVMEGAGEEVSVFLE